MNNEHYIITWWDFDKAKGTKELCATEHLPTSKKEAASYLWETHKSVLIESVIQRLDGKFTDVTDEVVSILLDGADAETNFRFLEDILPEKYWKAIDSAMSGSSDNSWSDHVRSESHSSNFI